MNEKKITTLVDSENLMTKKSPRFRISLILLSLFLSIICSGCIFVSREQPEPPEYLFKEDLEGFKAFLEDDPEIVQYHLFIFDDQPLYGDVNINIQVDYSVWEHIEGIIRNRVMPRLTREVLLGLDEYVYHFDNCRVRLKLLKISFYAREENSATEKRITYLSTDKSGFNRWSIDEDGIEDVSKSPDYLSTEDVFVDSAIFDTREVHNEKDLNAMLVSREPAVDWLCTYTSDRENLSGGRAGEKCFVTKIQLNDDSVTYEEVERLFKDLVTGENGRILKKIRSSEEGMWLFSGRTTAMKVVFLVNGMMEYISFESYDKSGFGKWTVTQSFPDPSKEGRVISSISTESVLTGIGITVVVLAAVGAVTYILVRRLRRNKKRDLKQGEAGET